MLARHRSKSRGNIVLSRRAILEEERESLRAETVKNIEKDAVLPGIVKNITNYGVFVDLGGVDGLLHVTDISWGRITSPNDFFSIGDKIEVKILDYDKASGKVALGYKQLKPNPWELVEQKYPIDSRVTGKVVNITNYGAFIDVGGIQGLLHISEMSFGRIKHPSEVMKEGDTIKVKVLKIDKKKKRISLGRRDILPNPWETVTQKFKPGQVVEGVVVRTADFGAFIKLDDYFEGLAHISELVDNKISHAKEVFNPGDRVNVLIMNVDRKNKRIKLSVRRAAEAERRREVEAFMKEQGDLENVFAARLQEALSDSDLEIAEEEKVEEPVKAEDEPEVAEAPTVVTEDAEEAPSEEIPVEETESEAEEAEAVMDKRRHTA